MGTQPAAGIELSDATGRLIAPTSRLSWEGQGQSALELQGLAGEVKTLISAWYDHPALREPA